MKDAFAIIYADQGDARLRELIELRSVSALPVGGRYRAIDFVLSNVAHSGIRSVGIITQRNYKSLMDHLGSGKDWDLSRKQGGLMMLPPFDLGSGSGIYRGLCDALFAKRDFIDNQKQKYCLLLHAGLIYKQDYNALMEAHVASSADITLLCSRDPSLVQGDPHDEMGVFVDARGRVSGVEIDRYSLESGCASMKAVLIGRDLLVRLVEDACAEGRYDFNRDVIQANLGKLKIQAVEHTGYVGNLNSVKAYFDVNMDMAQNEAARADLFDAAWPPYTKVMDAAPVRFDKGCSVSGSIFGNGCDVRGAVRDSVLFRGVSVEAGADIEHCIVMQNAKVGAGCHLRNAIIDKDAVVCAGARIVATPDDPVVVRKGAIVEGSRHGR